MPVITRNTDADSGRPISVFNTTLFNVLTTLGVFSIAAVLGPALFSSRVKRSTIWFSTLISWLMYSVSYLLLLGRQIGPANPPLGLCIFQASLIYATTPLCAVATACLVVDFFHDVFIVQIKGKRIGRRTAKTLVLLPWIIGLVVCVETILCVQNMKTASRDVNHFYCHIDNRVPTLTNITVIFLCGVFTVPVGVYTAIILHRNWTAFKRMSREKAHIALFTFFRLTLFTALVSFAMGISVFTATSQGDFTPDVSILLTTLPTFSALCLGTQRDIIGVWLFWRQEISAPSILVHHPKETKAPSIVIEIPSPVLGSWKSGLIV
ncbi:hypothetical protein BDZ94DRAFT_1308650 [Collybia nuda]|uniref:Uncharacterized protein n=1 Tax=Collybia nuda TaxID=64659 RepID=A0A9P5Y9E5_9AGAR|nr:hypothetical protein BDZ94DRAFT_1308650 [Collybia nuda]